MVGPKLRSVKAEARKPPGVYSPASLTYFYQMVERVLREELAVAFGESQQEAGRRLLEVLR